MEISEFIEKTYIKDMSFYIRPVIVCNDGFEMSVQASSSHYCNPRKSSSWYDECEIGFPNRAESLIMNYAEDKETPTGTVYGYVPVEIIQQVIEKHGGINLQKTFKDN